MDEERSHQQEQNNLPKDLEEFFNTLLDPTVSEVEKQKLREEFNIKYSIDELKNAHTQFLLTLLFTG